MSEVPTMIPIHHLRVDLSGVAFEEGCRLLEIAPSKAMVICPSSLCEVSDWIVRAYKAKAVLLHHRLFQNPCCWAVVPIEPTDGRMVVSIPVW